MEVIIAQKQSKYNIFVARVLVSGEGKGWQRGDK
jgi:hypothetical protein